MFKRHLSFVYVVFKQYLMTYINIRDKMLALKTNLFKNIHYKILTLTYPLLYGLEFKVETIKKEINEERNNNILVENSKNKNRLIRNN